MPEPIDRGRRYLPGLDGLRALAVAAVVLYHLGFGWAAGGFVGVGVFFTLSGYLITDLVLAQAALGEFRLTGFWSARARRLLPALALLLAVVTGWVLVAGRVPAHYGASIAGAALYATNWQLISRHVPYFARFGPPPPLQHLWSLAVEEQFYVVWPVLLLLGARVVRERGRAPSVRPRLAALTAALAAASCLEMWLLYRPGFDTSRVYFGTDTRAFQLLAGAALALVWPSRRLRRRIRPGARRVLDLGGLAALAAIGVATWRIDEYSPFVYRGGFLLVTAATVVLVASLAHPAGTLGDLLGAAPLRWVGVRSYGIYLWHLPVIVLTTPAGDHRPHLLRSTLQVAGILALAGLSWRFVEDPVRHGALGRLRRAGKLRAGRPRAARSRGPLRLGLALVAAVVAALLGALVLALTAATSPRTAAGGRPPANVSRVTLPAAAPSRVARWEPRTSCRAVVHVGDSTSEGLTSTSYLPNPAQRIDARYRSVGVREEHFEIAGARSIVETYDGEPNAAEVVQAWKAAHYRGCWVLALGTNDTADVAVGSHVGRLARIRELMQLIGRRPVLWVNVKSLLATGPYSEQNMRAWNEALLQTCRSYPTMHVYDWSAAARATWFISDGIHYSTPGYAQRATRIAHALAAAFPAGRRRPGCVVG